MTLVKFLKVAKPVMLFVSMSLSAILYAFFLGPWLAILFVFLLLVHEMGHVIAMHMKGFDTPTPVFIPFLGAAIFAPKFTDRHTEAFVGYGGPLLGTIGTVIMLGVWWMSPKDSTTSHVLIVGTYLSAYLNLFNLLPISPLDGGRVTQAVGTWFKYIGLLLLLALSLAWRQPVILYVWILVLFDLTMIPVNIRGILIGFCWVAMATLMSLGYSDQPAWVDILDCIITFPIAALGVARMFNAQLRTEEPDVRPHLPQRQRIKWAVLYVALAVFLVGFVIMIFPHLPHQLR